MRSREFQQRSNLVPKHKGWPLNNPERQIVHLKGQIQLLNALIIQLVEVAPLESAGRSPIAERLLSVQRLLGEQTPARAAFESDRKSVV